MKKRISLIMSLIFVLALVFALSVGAADCTEHEKSWSLTLGNEGYLGEIKASCTCSVCGELGEVEIIKPLFETLGFSYSEDGGMIQHYAVNRASLKRYEELSGETVRFGGVTATRNHVSENPLDENGSPVSEKIIAADFTDTPYDVFDIAVKGIPEQYRGSTEILCCAYVIAAGKVTYIDNCAEKINAGANTHTEVAKKVDNNETDKAELGDTLILGGTRYKALSVDELGLTRFSYWNSGSSTSIYGGTDTTSKKFFATRKLEKSELPNGTIIMIANGWSYRPEAWVDNNKNSGEGSGNDNARPATVSKSVVVNDEWWGVFNKRAFNITKNVVLSDTVTSEDIYKVFKIYIPLSAPHGDAVIPPVDADESYFNPTWDKEKQDWAEDGALKILAIGNSFSDDAMEYVYQAAKSAGIENVTLGNMFIGGCSLDTHLSNAKNNKGAYTYRTNTNGEWVSVNSYKISTAVQSEDWDFITVQQVSGYSGDPDSYGGLEELLSIIEPLNPSAKLAWHMTWAYAKSSGHGDFAKYDNDQMTMYGAIVDTVNQLIIPNEKIDVVIPSGTSIQNMRTSYVGDTLTRDGYHLKLGIGRYIASLTYLKALTGVSIDGITFTPDDVDANELLAIIEAVNNACKSPYEVTESVYVTEPDTGDSDGGNTGDSDGGNTGGDSGNTGDNEGGNTGDNEGDNTGTGTEIPEGYRQLTLEEMGWQESTFWNRSQFNHDSSNSFHRGYYGTVNTFTSEDIPVGSIIILKQGENWQYRPEGWGGSGARPDNTSVERVLVTEAWWEGYTTRAFNLSKTSSSAINTYTPEEIYEILRIYVPVQSTEEEPDADSIVDSNGLVKSEAVVDEVTTINGVEYKALTAEAMGLVPTSFYWSEKSTELWYDESMMSEFFATKVFEKEELVSGMLIWAADGWQYRPEGWVGTNLNSSSSRPANVKGTTEVSDSWWGSFTSRAFNISLDGTPILANEGYTAVEQIYEVFKIYVPLDKIAQ